MIILTHEDSLEDITFQCAMAHASGASSQIEEPIPLDENFLTMMRHAALF